MFIDENTLFEKLDELKADDIIFNYKRLTKWQIKVEIKNDEWIKKYGKYYLIDTYTPVKKVNQKFKEFYKSAYDKKKIFKESKKASTRVIKTAMESAGFYQTNHRYMADDSEHYENEKVYEDCIDINNALGFDDWKEMF
jgi:hypothetical protein